MNKKIWVVECKFIDTGWGICDFTRKEYSSTNYYTAHRFKRNIQKYLKTQADLWTKNHFRLVKYKPPKE